MNGALPGGSARRVTSLLAGGRSDGEVGGPEIGAGYGKLRAYHAVSSMGNDITIVLTECSTRVWEIACCTLWQPFSYGVARGTHVAEGARQRS